MHAGGADRKVKLWEVDSGVCVQEYSGHSDVVRDIKVVSYQIFISAANDRLSITVYVFSACYYTSRGPIGSV